jgi:hypothetical protein
MLWRRATPAGGFWGFLAAILVSIWMWAYVHTFPEGYRAQPKLTLAPGAVVTLEKTREGNADKISRIVVESGKVDLLNVGQSMDQTKGMLQGSWAIKDAPLAIAPVIPDRGNNLAVQILAPEVVLSGTKETLKFGVEAVPVLLKPGVEVNAASVTKTFVPSAFNPKHAKLIARSEKAKPMAVNMYSAWWSFVVCVSMTILVSLFTKPKPDSELKDLVMGLTTMPDEGPCPWYRAPVLWAGVVCVILVAVNIIFW